MPPKKKSAPAKTPAGPRVRNTPIDITNWRQQSQNRARERNRITFMAPALGDRMRELRVSKGMSQPEVAYGQWRNWQRNGLQNRRLGVRVPPALLLV